MSKERAWTRQSLMAGAAVILVLVTGLVHLVETPANYAEAAYKGILFFLNAVGAAVAAYGIYRHKTWGWGLGLFVTGGALIFYIVNRTVGLPGLEVDPQWFEPIGILSVIVESVFIILGVVYLARYRKSVPRDGSQQRPLTP